MEWCRKSWVVIFLALTSVYICPARVQDVYSSNKKKEKPTIAASATMKLSTTASPKLTLQVVQEK